MIKAWNDVKSFVTIIMTIALIVLLFFPIDPPKELLALFCTSYGAVITYFFTKTSEKSKETTTEISKNLDKEEK